MSEVLSPAQFQDELRRAARLDAPCLADNPLAAAVNQIQQNPTFAQSRLLTRILNALTYERGDFRRAEISALDSATRAIVMALINASCAGTTTRAQWEDAVNAANAAQRVAGG